MDARKQRLGEYAAACAPPPRQFGVDRGEPRLNRDADL
jgi:hypothetical protein